MHCDIVSINETHLINTDELNLNELDYKWIGFNRINNMLKVLIPISNLT
jgi:hypothetical protein